MHVCECRVSVGDLSEHVRVMYRIMYLCCAL